MNHRTIRTAIAAALLSLLAIGARADLAALVPYTVPVETVKPLALSVMSGESATWQFSFTEGGVAKDLTGAQSAAMAYTRTGVTYQVSGLLHSLTGGVVRVAWVATNATPAGIYNYVLSVVTGNVALCRARGVLTVGPAMEAVDGSAPVWTLDAAIAAESAARLSGDVVAMTNWQARVNALTNGAALGASALQPSATNTLAAAAAHAATAHEVTDSGGFQAGTGATAQGYGAAVGEYAATFHGGAVGYSAWASGFGGAVGAYALTSDGFAGGLNAWATDDGTITGTPIDAIQLGTGGNSETNTLQVYTNRLLNADGTIPVERFAATLNASNAADRAYADGLVADMPDWGVTNNLLYLNAGTSITGMVFRMGTTNIYLWKVQP